MMPFVLLFCIINFYFVTTTNHFLYCTQRINLKKIFLKKINLINLEFSSYQIYFKSIASINAEKKDPKILYIPHEQNNFYFAVMNERSI